MTGYKNYVMDNYAYWNQQCVNTTVPPSTTPTDGNGIIIDDNMKTQSSKIAYNGRTLVANNISFDNGGSGIHAFSRQHVDIVANISYETNNIFRYNDDGAQAMEGQIFSYQSGDIKILNNIFYSLNGPCCSSVSNASSITEDHNLIFPRGSVPVTYNVGFHDVIGDPLFATPGSGNFMISSTSPARHTATSNLEPSTDIYGTTQPQAHGYDIGALESTAP